jgi:hypothetical protein
MNEIVIMLNKANEQNIIFNKEQIDFFEKYLNKLKEEITLKTKQ